MVTQVEANTIAAASGKGATTVHLKKYAKGEGEKPKAMDENTLKLQKEIEENEGDDPTDSRWIIT